jgi:cytidine deaminase
MQILKFSQLNATEKKLINAAQKASKNAYVPYLKTKIGAAVLTMSNKIITAACFGPASTTANLCAERAVVATANAQGQRKIKILAIFGSEQKKTRQPLPPCGLCRQFLWEVTKTTGRDLIIFSSNPTKTKIIKTSIKELFPYPYSRY